MMDLPLTLQSPTPVLSILPKPVTRSPSYTLSFVSTHYVYPIVDLLLLDIPQRWRAEVRLGLHEALVNAAVHGNQLDTSKRVTVRFVSQAPLYKWTIIDEGQGFDSHDCRQRRLGGDICDSDECGRGVYILKQVFDWVEWNDAGNELTLSKAIHRYSDDPVIL